MKQESELFVRNIDVGQKVGNIIHVPATTLHSVSSPWPFYKWGIDIVGHSEKEMLSFDELSRGAN